MKFYGKQRVLSWLIIEGEPKNTCIFCRSN